MPKRAFRPRTRALYCLECTKKGVSQSAWECRYCGWKTDPESYRAGRAALEQTKGESGREDVASRSQPCGDAQERSHDPQNSGGNPFILPGEDPEAHAALLKVMADFAAREVAYEDQIKALRAALYAVYAADGKSIGLPPALKAQINDAMYPEVGK